MKYDLSKKQTQGARRTLRAFSNALVALLEQKPFESIQVNELCQACMIPKSTFYNYFDDKYDLLNYLFQRWEEQIYPEVSQIGAPSRRAQEVLRRLLDTVEQQPHQDPQPGPRTVLQQAVSPFYGLLLPGAHPQRPCPTP